MEIRYIKNRDIDKSKWDETVRFSKNGLIYAYSWYLDIVSNNWDALIAADYSYIFPLIWEKKYFINYIYQPYFTQQSGVFSNEEITEEIILAFLYSIPKKFKLISINLNFRNKIKSRKILVRKNYILNLNKEYNIHLEGFKNNTKRNIKKAENNKLEIKKISRSKVLFDLKSETLDSNIDQRVLKKLDLLADYALKNDSAEIFGVYDKEVLLSVTMFMYSHNRAYYLSAASNEEGKKKKASFYLVNEFIKKNAGKNLILDFEGSNIPGIARFFEGWGAEMIPYYKYEDQRLSFISWFKKETNEEV